MRRWILSMFPEFRALESECADLHARLTHAESEMEDYADETHDAQVKLELLRESERRAFEEMTLQSKRREDWWAMNARLAPIHFATPDHPQALAQPDLTPVQGKRLAREVVNEETERFVAEMEQQMRAEANERQR